MDDNLRSAMRRVLEDHFGIPEMEGSDHLAMSQRERINECLDDIAKVIEAIHPPATLHIWQASSDGRWRHCPDRSGE